VDTQPPAGDGHIRLTVQGSLIGRSRFGVRCRVDGEPVTVAQHGETRLPVAAGRHRVEVFKVFTGEYGNATVDVDVPAHGEAPAYYAPPIDLWGAGRMGPVPQQPSGTWFLVTVGVLIALGVVWAFLPGR